MIGKISKTLKVIESKKFQRNYLKVKNFFTKFLYKYEVSVSVSIFNFNNQLKILRLDMILNIYTKVKIKSISIFIWWYLIQLLQGLIIHAIYKTRAGSILAIDRPGIQTWMFIVFPSFLFSFLFFKFKCRQKHQDQDQD